MAWGEVGAPPGPASVSLVLLTLLGSSHTLLLLICLELNTNPPSQQYFFFFLLNWNKQIQKAPNHHQQIQSNKSRRSRARCLKGWTQTAGDGGRNALQLCPAARGPGTAAAPAVTLRRTPATAFKTSLPFCAHLHAASSRAVAPRGCH